MGEMPFLGQAHTFCGSCRIRQNKEEKNLCLLLPITRSLSPALFFRQSPGSSHSLSLLLSPPILPLRKEGEGDDELDASDVTGMNERRERGRKEKKSRSRNRRKMNRRVCVGKDITDK
jgi:hypothetical protein